MSKPELDLSIYSQVEIYEAFHKRAWKNKFLTGEQRQEFEYVINEYENGYIRDEGARHTYEDFCCTRICAQSYTDSEIMNQIEDLIKIEQEEGYEWLGEKAKKLYIDLIAERELLEVKHES